MEQKKITIIVLVLIALIGCLLIAWINGRMLDKLGADLTTLITGILCVLVGLVLTILSTKYIG